MQLILVFLNIIFLTVSKTFLSQAPTWLTSPFFRAGNERVIKTVTGNTERPQYTFTYTTALPGIPYLAYGVKNYRGSDYMMQEYFEIRKLDVNQTNFQVEIQIFGVTNIQILTVAYIAVDPTFPHLINSFDNTPLNYSSGNLVNISTASMTHTYFEEYINFTQQSSGSSYTQFPQPLTGNRVVLYITNLWINSASTLPLQVFMDTPIVNSSHYVMNLSLYQYTKITKISFSQIIFNQDDIKSSNKYFVVLDLWNITDAQLSNNYYQVPIQFVDNFIMAVTTFTTLVGHAGFQYQWEFIDAELNADGTYKSTIDYEDINDIIAADEDNSTTPSDLIEGTFGILVEPSVLTHSSYLGFASVLSSVFYIMTWQCSSPYHYFNLTSRMCQTLCGQYYYEDQASYTCQPCDNTKCFECDLNDTTLCIDCDASQNWLLIGQDCICNNSGYYAEVNNQCPSCSDLNFQCLTCTYSGNISLPFDSSSFVCILCNESAGYFINSNTEICEQCIISNCLQCNTLSTCKVCDTGFGVDSNGACNSCPIIGCSTCVNSSYCQTCESSYYNSSGLCYSCGITCSCGGYVLPKLSSGDCSGLCGDGYIIFPSEACDDNNTINGDGCSSACSVQEYFSCSGEPSICYMNTNIKISLKRMDVLTDTCNQLQIIFTIEPPLSAYSWSNLNWNSFVSSPNSSIKQVRTSVSNGQIAITYEYSETIQNKQLNFDVDPSNLLPNSTMFSQLASVSYTVSVSPNNNLQATHCDSSKCTGKEDTQSYFIAITYIAYLGLLLSSLTAKIIGLEMFGVLQLNYLILSDYDNINIVLAGSLARNEVNGPTIQTFSSNNYETVSQRAISNGFNSEDFLNNFNIMFLLIFIVFAIGAIMYLVTYIINLDQQQILESKPLKQQQSTQTRSQYFHGLSKRILKQVFLTFIMFSALNIGFSTGLQIIYIDIVNPFSIICMLICLTFVFGCMVALQKCQKYEYGEFKNKFGQGELQTRYIFISLLYRFILGLLLSLLNEYPPSGLIFLFLSSLFLFYIYNSQPFNSPYHNYRSLFIHSCHIIIILIYIFYRFQANYDIAQASQMYLPTYILLTVIGVSILVSFIVTGYQIFLFIEEKCGKKDDNGEIIKSINTEELIQEKKDLQEVEEDQKTSKGKNTNKSKSKNKSQSSKSKNSSGSKSSNKSQPESDQSKRCRRRSKSKDDKSSCKPRKTSKEKSEKEKEEYFS